MLDRLRRWLQAQSQPDAHPRPTLVHDGDTLELRFARNVGQSRMACSDPDRLLIAYTRTMLAALLLQPRPQRIGVVGLGGGSQVKYLYRHLPDAAIEVLEINPHVLARRDDFHVPPDDARLQVIQADAADFLALSRQRGRYDLLLVDGYDATGIPAALSTQAFYDCCRDALRPDGVFSSNLYCDDHAEHVARLQIAFGVQHVCVLDEPAQSNRVAFALREESASAQRLEANVRALPTAIRMDLQAELARLMHAVAGLQDEAASSWVWGVRNAGPGDDD